MQIRNYELFCLHADLCKALANAKRLIILDVLSRKEEIIVGDLAGVLECPMTTVSRHLKALKSVGLVEPRNEGQMVYYRLKNRRIVGACKIIREVLIEEMEAKARVAKTFNADLLSE